MIAAIMLSTLVGVIVARPNSSNPTYTNRYEYNMDDSGDFSFVVDTIDGFHHDAKGEFKDKELVVKGSYYYIGPDGVKFTIEYIADRTGFHPTGKHIPSVQKTPPEMPLPKLVIGDKSAACLATLCGTGLG